MKTYPNLYIDGIWSPASGGMRDVVNPATDQVIGQVAEATSDDVYKAVAAAKLAFSDWSQLSSQERASYISKLTEQLEAHQDELVDVITAEMGCPVSGCYEEQVEGPIEGMRSYISRAALMDHEEMIGNSLHLREPVGVVSMINPWNYPLHQVVGKVAPALAAGCTMICKPSELSPINCFVFAECVDAAGIPKGVFNLVQGSGAALGEAMCTHPDVDMVSFTGSVATGARIAQMAAPTVKRVTQELGGKSPCIITDDCPNFKDAVIGALYDVMFNTGQTCTAQTRMLVPASRYEEAVAIAKAEAESIVVGDPTDKDTFMGPLVSQQQRERVLKYIQIGIDEGARLVTGGVDMPDNLQGDLVKGAFVKPTIFADVDNGMRIAQEEIFGPVTCILPYSDIDEAIAIANDTVFGLSSGVWAKDKEAGIAIGKRIRAGMVFVNGGAYNHIAAFGGYKQSGNGREWGDEGLKEYYEVKSMQL